VKGVGVVLNCKCQTPCNGEYSFVINGPPFEDLRCPCRLLSDMSGVLVAEFFDVEVWRPSCFGEFFIDINSSCREGAGIDQSV
jgi:hypothetical protein